MSSKTFFLKKSWLTALLMQYHFPVFSTLCDRAIRTAGEGCVRLDSWGLPRRLRRVFAIVSECGCSLIGLHRPSCPRPSVLMCVLWCPIFGYGGAVSFPLPHTPRHTARNTTQHTEWRTERHGERRVDCIGTQRQYQSGVEDGTIKIWSIPG